jgi:hypothetical protein
MSFESTQRDPSDDTKLDYLYLLETKISYGFAVKWALLLSNGLISLVF